MPLARPVVALLAAAVSVVFAAVAAAGPAHAERATYTWPPAASAGAAPGRGWYAPLPLLNRVPGSLSVALPCGLSPALAGSTGLVLATARATDTAALRIVRSAGEVRVSVGGRERARIPWPAGCPATIEVAGGKLQVGAEETRLELGTLDDMPIVTGLFTTLDLRRGRPPLVSLRTRPYDTSFTALQDVSAALAALFALAALWLCTGLRGRVRSPRPLLRRLWGARDPTDAVVLAALLAWWVVAPVFTDDGWVWAEAREPDPLGGVSVLYDVWGLVAPAGSWFLALVHPVVGTTHDLVVMRIPALVALLVAWPLCRWCLRAAVGGPPPPVARWALAGAFLVGSLAWGMTVRPEPIVSLLALVVLAAMLAFVRAARPGLLVLAALCLVLAIAAHPAGVVAAAPVLAAAPAIGRWLRAGGRAAGALLASVVVSAVSVGLLLFVAGADLGTRLDAVRIFGQADRHREPPWREYVRYQLFDQNGGGDVGRRLSLALLVLAGAAWLLRRRVRPERVLAEPGCAIPIGLVLLAFVSSKWPWHFGTLAAIGAVAIGAESARLRLSRASLPRSAIAGGAVLVAALYAWRAPDGWSPLDLQRYAWTDAFNGWSLRALVLVAVAAALVGARRARPRWPAALSAFPGVAVTLTCLTVVVLTAALLIADAARSPWSPARQNLEALGGRSSCGLGDQLTSRLAGGEPTLLAPAIATYLPCATPARVERGVLQVPALVAFQGDPWPITEPDGPYTAIPELYRLEPAAESAGDVKVEIVDRRIPGFRRLDAARAR